MSVKYQIRPEWRGFSAPPQFVVEFTYLPFDRFPPWIVHSVHDSKEEARKTIDSLISIDKAEEEFYRNNPPEIYPSVD